MMAIATILDLNHYKKKNTFCKGWATQETVQPTMI